VRAGSVEREGVVVGALHLTARHRAAAGHVHHVADDGDGGANALIGGSNRTITLQPVSIQAQEGLNLAVGVAALTLRPE